MNRPGPTCSGTFWNPFLQRICISVSNPISIEYYRRFDYQNFKAVYPGIPTFIRKSAVPGCCPVGRRTTGQTGSVGDFSSCRPNSTATNCQTVISRTCTTTRHRGTHISPVCRSGVSTLISHCTQGLTRGLGRHGIVSTQIPSVLVSKNNGFPITGGRGRGTTQSHGCKRCTRVSGLLSGVHSINVNKVDTSSSLTIRGLAGGLRKLRSRRAAVGRIGTCFQGRGALSNYPRLAPRRTRGLGTSVTRS